MFCPNCGKKVSKEAEFCPYCGKKLDHEEKPAKEQFDNNNNQAAPQNKEQKQQLPKEKRNAGKNNKGKRSPWVLTIIIIAILALIAFFAGYQIGNSQNTSSSEAASSSSTNSSSSETSNTASSKALNLNDKQLAGAILYYAQGHLSDKMWKELYQGALNKSTKVTADALPDNVTANGDGTMHAIYPDGLAFGGEVGYVLGDGGQTIYLYEVGPGVDEISPKLTVSLNDIKQYVKSHDAMDEVNQIAGNVTFSNN